MDKDSQHKSQDYHGAMKNLSADDKPREKALKDGTGSLSTSELLAILIGSGTPGESVVDLCKRIMHDNENLLHQLARRSVKDLTTNYHGIGEAKAITILAALELARRYDHEEFHEPQQMHTPNMVYSYLKPLMAHLTVEEVHLLILDRAKRLKNSICLSIGGTAASIVEVKTILKTAILYDADSIILAHNHPSCNLNPSKQDHEVTKLVKEGCEAIGIHLTDHIIVAQNGYYSFVEQGIL